MRKKDTRIWLSKPNLGALFLGLFICISASAQNHKKYYDQGICAVRGLEEEGTITNGKKEGYWKFYYFCLVRQDVREEGYYSNDKRTGVWKYHSPHGFMYKTVPFVNGLENGVCTEYHQSGEVESEVTYENGKIKGERKFYFENGKVSRTENFETGEIKDYYQNSRIKEAGFYDVSKWLNKEGEWKKYHENGNVKTVGTFVKNEYTGTWNEYYENKQLRSKGEMNGFRRKGRWEFYHRNGKLSAIGDYKENGYPQPGSWKTYDQKGQRDSANCPEPSQDQVARVAVMISSRAESDHDELIYRFEEELWLLSCADPESDNSEVAVARINKMWNKYGKEMAVHGVLAASGGKNILKYMAEKQLLTRMLNEYKVDVNFIDPADGKTVLDFVKHQIDIMEQKPDPVDVELYKYLVNYGAKTAGELK